PGSAPAHGRSHPGNALHRRPGRHRAAPLLGRGRGRPWPGRHPLGAHLALPYAATVLHTFRRRMAPVKYLPLALVVGGFALLGQAEAQPAGDAPANQWIKQDKAMIGPDAPIAVVWPPHVKRFMSLGWISSQYDKRVPYTYDELSFDPASGQWENWFP